jgi:hypothetical protein
VLQRTGGVHETTLPMSQSLRDRIREVAELSGDENLLRIAELDEQRISLEKFRDLDPQIRVAIGCRLDPQRRARGSRAISIHPAR